MAVTVTHSKTLISPDSGVEDKVYGSDYVDPASHSIAGLGTGVDTALGIDVGDPGAVVVNGGDLGTPSAGVATNLTGTAAGLTAGNVTTNADLTGIVTSSGNATAIADKAIALAKLADGTAGNVIAYDASGVISAVATGTATHVLTSNGAGAAPTFQAAAGGGATLNGITAATADQAGIANGDWNIRWNWQKTTNSEVAFELGESAASTNGTSTGDVPNQVIAKFSTLAASTASPLQVYAQGVHAFSVSPTSTPQILARPGAAATPTYSFANASGYGMYQAGTALSFCIAGTGKMKLITNRLQIPNGTSTTPGLTDVDSFADSGISWLATNSVSMVNATAGELIRATGGASPTFQFKAAAYFSANAAVATSLTGVGPTGANTTVQEWLTIKNADGTTRYIPCF
jgi:hypothetical protein